jgi:hypothetical protein
MSTSNDYSIRVLTSTEALHQAEDEWRQLEREVAHINFTVSYDWLRVWWEVFQRKNDNKFGRNKQLRILLLSRDGRLEAIAPLVRLHRWHRFRKVTAIEFLGQQWSGNFADFIARTPSPEITDAVLQWLQQNERFDVLHLSYIPQDTAHFDLQDSRVSTLSACAIIYRKDYDDYDAYRKTVYSKNFRNCVRKNYNRLKGRDLKFERVVVPGDLNTLAEIMRLSKCKLADGKHSLYMDKHKAEFVTQMINTMESRIEFLRINDQNAIYLLLFHYGGGVFAYDTSYNRDYHDLSLGRLSFVENIREFFTDNRYAFHCAGVGLGFHKRGHYPDALRVYSFTAPGNTKRAGRIAETVLAQDKVIEQRFLAELSEWSR